jgi:hypothetical protein
MSVRVVSFIFNIANKTKQTVRTPATPAAAIPLEKESSVHLIPTGEVADRICCLLPFDLDGKVCWMGRGRGVYLLSCR